VERQVDIVRAHVLAGRRFASVGEMDRAFTAWLPLRRAQVHRTHGEVIAVRAERDRAALRRLPSEPYVVAERHLRVVGKDCLVSFEASHYSVPWRHIRPGRRVELRVTAAEVAIWNTGPGAELLATHRRAERRGQWVIDEAHWNGLPGAGGTPPSPGALIIELNRAAAPVAHRALAVYDEAAAQ
jgi:hypothetical protein